jgi:hypothetical protein
MCLLFISDLWCCHSNEADSTELLLNYSISLFIMGDDSLCGRTLTFISRKHELQQTLSPPLSPDLFTCLLPHAGGVSTTPLLLEVRDTCDTPPRTYLLLLHEP